jgi:hypothetical protein
MTHRILNVSAVAALLVSLATLGGPVALASTTPAVRSGSATCHAKNGFKACIVVGGNITARGRSNGACATYPAYVQISGPFGHRQSAHVSDWCEAVLKVHASYTPGVWVASVWEGPNPAGHYIRLVSAHTEMGGLSTRRFSDAAQRGETRP